MLNVDLAHNVISSGKNTKICKLDENLDYILLNETLLMLVSNPL